MIFLVNIWKFHGRKLLYHVELRRRRGDPEHSTDPEKPAITEPEGTSAPEKNLNSTSEPEPEPEIWPEPEPDWDTAFEKWKAAWPIHVYGFATILVVLGLVSLFELVRIHVKSRRKTALKISLLLMIVLFCATRAVALFIDPYGSNANFNPMIVRLLFSIGHPCVISAMSLLLLVLIDTTKMNVAPPTFQRVQTIIVVVIFHVILVLVTDVVVAFYVKTKFLILMCQVYYLVMGLALTIGYARVGWKIAKNSSASVSRDRKMEKLKRLIAVASVTGLIMAIVTIYGAAGVFGIYSDVTVVEAWPWWAFQTIGRTVEVVMVIVLLFMNINVSGSGHGLRQLFRNCRKTIFKNKVDEEKFNVGSIVYSNSWMACSTPKLDEKNLHTKQTMGK
ncbi:hypothetical protein QZH41_012467 [Actinostola sp. cb2023]|nr:hypothetical protein QZH41_012467 [Actinostola sp. cb2023]